MSFRLRYGDSEIPLPPGWDPDFCYAPKELPPVEDPEKEIARALNSPLGAPLLAESVRREDRVAVILPDGTRGAPRELMLRGLLAALSQVPDKNITLLIAYGKHPPESLSRLNLPPALTSRFAVVHHQAGNEDELADLSGEKNLSCRVNRTLLQSEVVIALGAIRPHYFAGFTGGAKSIVPGLAGLGSIRANHALREDPRCRLGILRGNIARKNQEDMAGLLKKFFVLNVVTEAHGGLLAAAFGHFVQAHRSLIPLARSLGQLGVRRAEVVVAGVAAPTSVNVYQLTKAVAPAAKVVKPGGTLIICGPCGDGVGGLHAVNDIIYARTLTRYLPPKTRCILVSELPARVVEETFFTHARDLPQAMEMARGRGDKLPSLAILPDAGPMIPVNEEDAPESW